MKLLQSFPFCQLRIIQYHQHVNRWRGKASYQITLQKRATVLIDNRACTLDLDCRNYKYYISAGNYSVNKAKRLLFKQLNRTGPVPPSGPPTPSLMLSSPAQQRPLLLVHRKSLTSMPCWGGAGYPSHVPSPNNILSSFSRVGLATVKTTAMSRVKRRMFIRDRSLILRILKIWKTPGSRRIKEEFRLWI